MSEKPPIPYNQTFYANQQRGSLQSAEVIVPLVKDILRPGSVLDVGCGVGVWLEVFKQHGVEDIHGIDGAYVDRNLLRIPTDRFTPHDLTQPFDLRRRFDLVVCLEVAEHLPGSSAHKLVDSLVRHAPAVLFSAAIPYQGGTEHINEQWPEYWAHFFTERGFVPIDCIRPKVWSNPVVEWWYAQNTVLYADRDYIARHSRLEHELCSAHPSALSLVHPSNYLRSHDPVSRSLRQDFARFRKTLSSVVERRIRRFW